MEVRPIAVSMIVVNDRQRKVVDPEELKNLADDIERNGLLHAIVISRDGTLLAGERRLRACRDILGWTHIPANFLDELPFRQQFLIEFTENWRRQNLTWEENAEAVSKYHDICCYDEGPKWTQENTANEIGLTQGTVSKFIQVHKMRDHKLVQQATSIGKAFNTVKRITERLEQDSFQDLFPGNNHIPNNIPYHPIQTLDFTVWAPAYTGPKFNVIHCDFPYGINAHTHAGQNRAERSTYDDSPETFWTLFKTLSAELDRFCAPAAHMIFWFSPNIYSNVQQALKLLHGFQWEEHPLIWMRGENEGIAPDPQRRPRRCYEMAFFGWRGDRKLVQTKANIFKAPTERETHPHEKNEEMLRHFLGMVVDSGTRIIDPTCGSASALRAASSLGAAAVLGLEADEFYAAAARRAYDNSGSGLRRDNGVSDAVAGGRSPNGQAHESA